MLCYSHVWHVKIAHNCIRTLLKAIVIFQYIQWVCQHSPTFEQQHLLLPVWKMVSIPYSHWWTGLCDASLSVQWCWCRLSCNVPNRWKSDGAHWGVADVHLNHWCVVNFDHCLNNIKNCELWILVMFIPQEERCQTYCFSMTLSGHTNMCTTEAITKF
jgi:hypothetical protein